MSEALHVTNDVLLLQLCVLWWVATAMSIHVNTCIRDSWHLLPPEHIKPIAFITLWIIYTVDNIAGA